MKKVIFDVGRVLIQWDINPLFLEFFESQAHIDRFISEVDFFEWNLELDRGKTFAQGVEEQSAKFPHYAHVFKQFDQRWQDTVPGMIDKSADILKELTENGVPTYAITNFSAEKWPIACQMFPFLGTSFIDTVVSGEVKMTKPNPAIYELCLSRNGLKAQDCIFIDDSQANVDSARALGIDGILFTSPEQFEDDLKSRNVL